MIVYIHNFAGFDVFFLIKYLVKFTKVKPYIHNGEFISIECKYNNVKIIFKDSFKHLVSSLDKLAKNFSVENKTLFPYFLYDLNYQGSFPEYKYFDNNKLSLEKYNKALEEFGDKEWIFEKEAVKYCEQDCRSLHQVITKYNELFFSNFLFNIHKYPTSPSLSFANYRTNFMKEANLANITGKVYKDIRLSYTGGATEMYIPYPLNNEQIHAYDVNSLYPFVMLNNDYPIGNPTYFQGNILNFENKPFGFFYCKIIAPDNLLHPILQIHYKSKDGIRTISPLGNFQGMFFSEELYNAEKFGYKFEVLWGYTFDKANIFKDYVETLYNMRLKYPKKDPMNIILKLGLNSLYGRFGMDDNLGEVIVINNNEDDSFYANNTLKDLIDLGDYLIVRTKDSPYELETKDQNSNVNIAIASAVTAYARIHMTHFKNNPNLPKLYYTDTDSAYFDGPLPDYLVSQTELGKMKLEGIFDKAIFLAPKVYTLQNDLETIIKIKGLSKEAIKENKITLDFLDLLLNKEYKLSFKQTKWFKSLFNANIKMLEQIYTLQVTSSKRDLVYNNEGKFIATKPLKLNN